MLIPLPRTGRAAVSLAMTAATVLILVASAMAAAATAKPQKIPRLSVNVTYLRAHDGPIDCRRAPAFTVGISAAAPKGTTSQQLKQMETGYRPRSGATLTVGRQRYDLSYTKSSRTLRSRQISWGFRPVPTTEAAGESARRATVRYKTKLGSQTLKDGVFAWGCV